MSDQVHVAFIYIAFIKCICIQKVAFKIVHQKSLTKLSI